MKIIKPKRLRPGDVIGICAPASPPSPAKGLEKGIRYLERLGFRVELGRHALRRQGYLAGSDAGRAEDINFLFANRHVKAVFVARGGYGAVRILPLLDYGLIRRNPKILVGYSDITALHFALLSRARLISFSGPMVAVELAAGMTVKHEEIFWGGLMSVHPPAPMRGTREITGRRPSPSTQTGRLLGGNLSLMAALVGTPYFPLMPHPVFLFEEIAEQPYRIDRLLQQVKLAGTWRHAAGIGIGRFIRCTPEKGKASLSLRRIFLETFSSLRIPVIAGIPFGHMKDSIPFPVGAEVRMNVRDRSIEFLESGVS